MGAYEDLFGGTSTVAEKIEMPVTSTVPVSSAYDDLFGDIEPEQTVEAAPSKPQEAAPREVTPPTPTATMEFTEPTEVRPPEVREKYVPPSPTPSYGTFGVPMAAPPAISLPEQAAAYVQRGLAAGKQLIAPEVAKTAILQPTQEKKTEAAKRAVELPKEAAMHGKAAETLVPTSYTSEKILERLDNLRGQKPNVGSSFQMGNLTGEADINVTNAFMSGDEEAKRIALDTQRQVRELAGEYQKVREARKGFINGVENVSEAVSGMLPMMGKSAAMSAIPVVGPVLSTSMWAKQGAGDIITQLKEDGAPDDVALAYGLAGGLAYALVEQVQLGRVLNPAVKKAVGNSVRKKIMSIAKEKGLDWFQNVREEVIQGLITENAIASALKASGIEVDRKELNDRYKKAIKENFTGSAWPMAVYSAVGLGAGAGRVAFKDRGTRRDTAPRITEMVDETTGEITPLEGERVTPPQGPITEMVDETTGEVTPIETAPKETLEDFDLDLQAFDNLPPEEQNTIFAQLSDEEKDRVLETAISEDTRTIEEIRRQTEAGEAPKPLPVPPIPAREKAAEEAPTEVTTEPAIEEPAPQGITERLPLLKKGKQAIRREAVESGMFAKTELEQQVEDINQRYEEKPTKRQVASDLGISREEAGKVINNSRFNVLEQPKEAKSGLQGQTETKIEGIPKNTIVKEPKMYRAAVEYTKDPTAEKIPEFKSEQERMDFWNAVENTYKEVPSAKEDGAAVEEGGREEGVDRGAQGRIRLRDDEKGRMEAETRKVAAEEAKQPILKEQPSEPAGKISRETTPSPAVVTEGKVPAETKKATKEVAREKGKAVRQRLETRQKRGRGVSKKPRRQAAVKRVAKEEKYTPEYWKAQHGHHLNVEVYNALKSGWKDRGGRERPGKQKGWVDDYNIITGSKAPGGSKNPTLSDNATQWLQETVDNIRESPEYIDELKKIGIAQPQNIDDVIAIAKGSMTAAEFTKFHNEFEKGIQESDANLDEYNEALRVFNEEPHNLTLEQKDLLEETWQDTVENVIAKERGETPQFAKGRERKFMQQDLFEDEKPVEQNEAEEKKRLEKEQVKKKTEEKKGGEADLAGLPLFEDTDLEGSQQTLKFAKGKVDTSFLEGGQPLFAKRVPKPEITEEVLDLLSSGKTDEYIEALDKVSENTEMWAKTQPLPAVFISKDRNRLELVTPNPGKNPFRVTHFANDNGTWTPTGHREYKTKAGALDDAQYIYDVNESIRFAKAAKKRYESKVPKKDVTPQERKLTDSIYKSVEKQPKYGSIQIVKDVSPDSEIGIIGKVVEDTTKKKVVFIKTDDRSLKPAIGFTIDGVSFPAAKEGVFKDTIYVNVDSTRPLMWTAYHEFAHFLETNPEYNKRFWGAVKLTDKGMAELAKEGQSELTADIIGEMMSRQDFWNNLSKQGKTPFEKILQEFMKIISRIRNSIRKLMVDEKTTDDTMPQYAEHLVDINAVRDELGKIYRDYQKIPGKDIGDIAIRLAKGKSLFRRSKLTKIPTTVTKPTAERMKEVVAQEKERERKAADLEKKIYAVRRQLKGLSRTSAEKRAELALKLDTMRGGQVWELKNAIYDYAKGIGLSGVPYNKVDLMLKNTKTVKELKKAVEYLDDVWNKFERRSMYTKVLDAVEKEYTRLQKIRAGKLRSAVPAEHNRLLKDYLDRLRTTPEWFKGDDYNNTVDRMINYFNLYAAEDVKKAENISELPQDIQDWVRSPDETPTPPTLQKLIRAMFQNTLSEMTTDQLQDVIDNIESIREDGRNVLEQQEFERMAEVNAKADEIAEIINKERKKEPTPEFIKALESGRKPEADYRKRLRAKTLWSLIDPERMVEWLGGFKEKGYEKIKEMVLYKLYDAEAKKIVNLDKAVESFKERHKDIKWHDAMYKTYLKVDVQKELEKVGLEYNSGDKNRYANFTLDNMMFYYAHSQNPGNLAHLRGSVSSTYMKNAPKALDEYHAKVVAFTDNIINKAIDNLPQKYKDAVDRQIQYYDEVQWERVNAEFERDIKVTMPKEAFYFPIQNISTERAENEIVADQLARASYRMATVQKGFSKSRVMSSAPFKQMSYFKAVVRNAMQVEHYIAYNQAVKETAAFLKNTKVRDAIEERSETVYKELDQWLKAVATGSIDKSNNWIDKRFDLLRKNFISFALAIKPTSILKQLGSMPKGMAYLDTPVLSTAKSNFEYLLNPKTAEAFADSKSALMRSRTKNHERELAEQNEKELLRLYAEKKVTPATVRDWGLAPMGWVDKQICVVLWNARYHEMIKKGATEEKAVRAADELIRKTQSRGGVLYMPSLYRNTGVLRGFTIFTSDTNQNINLAFELANKWGMKPTIQNLRFVFWTVLTSALIEFVIDQALVPAWTAIKKVAGSDDPEDWRLEEGIKGFASQYTRALPFYGQLVDALVALGVYNLKDLRGLIPDKRMTRFLLDFAPAGTQSIEDLGKAISEGDPRGVLEAIATARGIPTRTLMRFGKGAKEIAENGLGEWRKLFWSDYQLREETVYDAMARRFYYRSGPEGKQKELERMEEWYIGLHPLERKLFDQYRKEWFEKQMEVKTNKQEERVKLMEEEYQK